MLSIHDGSTRLCDGLSRRELLRVGGLSALGLTLPTLLQARDSSPGLQSSTSGSFGRAKNVLFVWLQGGPPQHETFDPKPDAPLEIRGEFRPIQTNIPGINFCELLPRTAMRADKLAVVRSLCTNSDLHDASAYWILTGYPYTGQQSRQISPTDWPYLGSVLRMLKPSETLPALTSVWLPDVMRLNDNVMPAGQTAGFLGKGWEPHRLICDPSADNFQIDGMSLPDDMPVMRLTGRRTLLAQVNQHFAALEQRSSVLNYSRHASEAYGLLASGAGRSAFDLEREPRRLRERYGLNKWGQSLILARRLIEAGSRLVHVNWARDPGDEAVGNPMWDTHAQNADRLQEVLCPIFDVGFSALLDDLEERGLLNETLVVAIGEFGRTPKINSVGGRDHWGNVFSFALAGAGISGGQVYGSSDRLGAYPKDGKLEPQDLTATIVHLLGLDHHATFNDAAGRPYHVTKGEPIWKLLGDAPATRERVLSDGNLAVVPTYSHDPLLNLGFEEELPLIAAGSAKRLKGWAASPLRSLHNRTDHKTPVLSVQILDRRWARPRSGNRLATLGFDLTQETTVRSIEASATVLLTQEIRNPRAGTFTVVAYVLGIGDERGYAQFLEHFRCRLIFFGYSDLAKDPTKDRREFVSVEFQAPREEPGVEYKQVSLSVRLRSQEDGPNKIEMGVGFAVLVEKKTPGELDLAPGSRAWLCVDDIETSFVPRPRNDDVTV